MVPEERHWSQDGEEFSRRGDDGARQGAKLTDAHKYEILQKISTSKKITQTFVLNELHDAVCQLYYGQSWLKKKKPTNNRTLNSLTREKTEVQVSPMGQSWVALNVVKMAWICLSQ